jgi:hypothetical protein
MKCQAKTAFKGPKMIAKNIWILGKINSLKSKLPETFASVYIGLGRSRYASTTELGPYSILKVT